jgi:hypothetical protein
MGIDWPMTTAEISEAIPPAFSHYIAEQWLNQNQLPVEAKSASPDFQETTEKQELELPRGCMTRAEGSDDLAFLARGVGLSDPSNQFCLSR